RIRGRRIAMILQDPMASLNPLFTIGDQVAEPIRVHEGVERASAWTKARDLLKAVRISAPETRVKEYPHQMSGGMRQRIVGAIAISCEPALLIADEPTTSLDVTIQAQYLNLLRELQRTHHLAMIFITHNLGIVAKMCDRVAVMYAGRIVESGPVSRIFNAPAHPYTEALLTSIPRLSDPTQRLTAIDGQPRDLASPPPGCAFHPRCPKAGERCREDDPPGCTVADGHTARCWPSSRTPSPRSTPACGCAPSSSSRWSPTRRSTPARSSAACRDCWIWWGSRTGRRISFPTSSPAASASASPSRGRSRCHPSSSCWMSRSRRSTSRSARRS